MNLLKNLDTGKFKFDFCTFGSQPGLYASQAEKLGAEIFHCPHSANPLVLGHRFRQILRAHRYDVVHSHVHLFSGAVLRWARQERVAIRIAHSHTSRDAKPNTVARRAYRSTMKRLLRRHATHGLAVSGQAAGDLFLNWKNDPRIAILRYGIDLKPFQDAVDSNLLRAKMGLPMGAQVIGHVGNFVLAKNHVFFLEVAGEIRKLRPGMHFLLIGDGPLRKDIAARALAMDLQGCMHFLGTRTDVPLLLRACMDAFVFPSLWEGLPIAVIEAQAAGLSCVISGEITDEVIVLSDQVLQLPLALGAKEWARNIIQKIDHEKFDAQSSVETMLQKGFAIQRNLSSLLDLYSGAPHGNSSPC
jgi:glycosyltransferase involved in cell wall biosynthesis